MGKQEAAGAAELRSRVQVGAAGERLHTQGVPRVKAVDYPFPVLLCGEQGRGEGTLGSCTHTPSPKFLALQGVDPFTSSWPPR